MPIFTLNSHFPTLFLHQEKKVINKEKQSIIEKNTATNKKSRKVGIGVKTRK